MMCLIFQNATATKGNEFWIADFWKDHKPNYGGFLFYQQQILKPKSRIDLIDHIRD